MQTALRPARTADFAFIHSIAGRAENRSFIEDAPDEQLAGFLASSDAELRIWELDGIPAGFALFCELDNPANKTELRRLALGRTDQGLGQRFLGDLIAYGFGALGRDRIWLDVVPDNPRALRSYEKAGFQREGRIRSTWKRPDGVVSDLIVLGLLRHEWQPDPLAQQAKQP
jgi:RimJ/RimL family protein N-acetyltransferase